MEEKVPIFGKTLSELQELVAGYGLPKFTAKQLADWLYKKEVKSIDDMTNLSLVTRDRLSEKFEIRFLQIAEAQKSEEGSQIKQQQ